MKLELIDVAKTYQGRMVLRIGNLQLENGKTYAVLGPNGSGKTTMLRLISAVAKADHGLIRYDDQTDFPGDAIAYLPQKPYLFDTTVLENLTLAINTAFSGKKTVRERARQALESFQMQHFSQTRALSLSGGEAQKIAILRTMILNRKLVLLDEPTVAVDLPSLKLVEDYIARVISRNKATLIFSTHNPSQAARLADEIMILWEGRLVEKGPCARVLAHPEQPETKAFLEYWAGACPQIPERRT